MTSRSMFEASVSADPPAGIAESAQSRAMFAADLMLAWEENKDTGHRSGSQASPRKSGYSLFPQSQEDAAQDP